MHKYRVDETRELTLWVGACDYYLGRMTYAVAEFCDMVVDNWDLLNQRTKDLIRVRVEEKYERIGADEGGRIVGPLGMKCDVEAWNRVRKLWS